MTRLMNGMPPPAPSLGRVEDDDVAAVVGVPARGELVDEDVLVRHRASCSIEPCWTLYGWATKVWMTEEDQERQDERLDDLEEAPERRSLTHKSGSIGAARAGRRPAGIRRRGRECILAVAAEFDPPIGLATLAAA